MIIQTINKDEKNWSILFEQIVKGNVIPVIGPELVRVGQKVNRSDIIGLVGSTGKSTGPHLHYEVHFQGHHVDPRNYYFYDLGPEQYDQMVQLSNNYGDMLD